CGHASNRTGRIRGHREIILDVPRGVRLRINSSTIVPSAASELICFSIECIDGVVASAAENGVFACAARDRIIAGLAEDAVVAVVADEQFGAIAAEDEVLAVAAVDGCNVC